MAELRKCKICGYVAKRCGITNHLKAVHPTEFMNNRESATEKLTIHLCFER